MTKKERERKRKPNVNTIIDRNGRKNSKGLKTLTSINYELEFDLISNMEVCTFHNYYVFKARQILFVKSAIKIYLLKRMDQCQLNGMKPVKSTKSLVIIIL